MSSMLASFNSIRSATCSSNPSALAAVRSAPFAANTSSLFSINNDANFRNAAARCSAVHRPSSDAADRAASPIDRMLTSSA